MCWRLEAKRTEVLEGGDRDYDVSNHFFISKLFSAKAWVTKLKTGLTIPCSKMSVLVLCSRLQARVSKLYSTGIP